MFRKSLKKSHPPGTFIPTPARICAIIQLCLAFAMILWNLSQPFSGDLFRVKSHMLLYEDLMGISSSEKSDRLVRNSLRTQQLAEPERADLLKNYQTLQRELQKPFLQKLDASLAIFLYQMPRYELAWLIFSVVLPILLLKKVEGASQAIWILPLLTLCYAIDNRWYATTPLISQETLLFPQEQHLVEVYLKTPLNGTIGEQHAQLRSGWHLYLIDQWVRQAPSSDPATFNLQVEEGEFLFNLRRIQLKNHLIIPQFPHKKHYLILGLYFFWNLSFALTVNNLIKN